MARTQKSIICLDTHIVCDLAYGHLDKLSQEAQEAIEKNELLVSPMVELELTYLHEIKRLPKTGEEIIGALIREIGLRLDDLPFSAVIKEASQIKWSRDPFDRLIVASCIANKAKFLLTRDQKIHQYFKAALK